ncbi:MAG: phosphatidylglycerol lysyltransferase domain-containing protein [Candidatus Omnitrophica bacterium]|nr:phosphatidylglycerol lysyltransferase domain-containing protein [Candidatus Omnitrophota bacterium]MDD5512169.1 phosphatidylglycerol lysyltransferase domain-containing protein [Candidatus Omnitrophota bacterium]
MKLRELSLVDRRIFQRYLGLRASELSVYNFTAIYIWKKLFKIEWSLTDGNLCVFFTDRIGTFLYLSPLGKKISPVALEESFRLMHERNRRAEFCRIEYAQEDELAQFTALGYECLKKDGDYLCLRSDLANLSGTGFKSKRSCVNYFTKHYDFTYSVFKRSDSRECLDLYRLWQRQRSTTHSDKIYRAMLGDTFVTLKVFLSACRSLGCQGRVVRVQGKIKAFSFGYHLNKDTFCILYEVADLKFKGLAQFIFREFSAELKEYTYINIMDDSGMENLKKTKLSYHPQRMIPAYVIRENSVLGNHCRR